MTTPAEVTQEVKPLSLTLGDIAECDREAIHISGAVQNHGCILFFTAKDQRIQSISQNCEQILKMKQKEILGAKLEHVLEPRLVLEIEEVVRSYPWAKTHERHLEFFGAHSSFDIYIFHSDGLFGVEFELMSPVSQESNSANIEINENLREFMAELADCTDTESLAQLTCQRIRKISGVDRAMMYRFLSPTWHGQVIAEDRVIKAHSYMGHRFPASDIPKPARDLYLRNQVRLIANVQEGISPILPMINPLTTKPIDLSDSRLRSVSPIHLEYLKNMNVAASFSLAIKVEGELWGLIACHHQEPFYLSQTKRAACELIANAFAAHGPLLEVLATHRSRAAFDLKLRKIFESLCFSFDPLEQLFKQSRSVTEVFESTGFAFVRKNHIDAAGLTPTKVQLQALAEYLREEIQDFDHPVFHSNKMVQKFESWANFRDIASGIMAIRVPKMDDGVLIFFRPEMIKTITWGGDPVKQLEKKNFQGQLNPRKSFEAWEEVIRNQSRDWTPYEMDGILFLRDVVFDSLVLKQTIIQDLTKSLERKGTDT